MKIGIIKEGKVPADKRVPFTPEQCKAIEQQFKGTKVYVQKSDDRCYSNKEYADQGIELVDNLEADSFFEGDELEIKLQKAIALLPEKQQLVFKMRYFEELKYEEISDIIGTSVGALKANYHHAVKKIEEFINNN
jgi:RNA polymerase sigma factor (sigma-70 family)